MVKASSSSSTSFTLTPLGTIVKLEAALLSTPFDPNPLLPLLAFARHPSPEVVHKAIWVLHRVFIHFIADGTTTSSGGDSEHRAESMEEEGNIGGWVRGRMTEYVTILGGLLRDSEATLRTSAVHLLFSLLTPLSVSRSKSDQPTIHIPYFRTMLDHILRPTFSERGSSPQGATILAHQVKLENGILPSDVVTIVQEEYWAKYDDLRWVFFREAAHALRNDSRALSHSKNLLGQLLPLTNLPKLQEDLNTYFIPSLSIPPSSLFSKKVKPIKAGRKQKRQGHENIDKLPDWMATYESDSSSSDSVTPQKGTKRPRVRTSKLSIHASLHSVPSHQNQFTSLWEEVLSKVPLDESWTRRMLLGLHGESGILGHMKPERRVRVADWLGDVVDRGGANALLAMNGLFVLMTQFNLTAMDYPNFYDRLYGLLDRNVLHVKYRARFFRLLDTFLASALLPATLVASYIKRLARLTLSAPPAGIIMVVPFIYNLLKRHPGCMVMIQRHRDEDSAFRDPYDETNPSPLTSSAISSSLWELAALKRHYLASISTVAKVFEEVFTKPEFNLEDFLDHGYGTLFETEINRKLKYPPALALAIDAPKAAVGEIFPRREAGKDALGDGDVVGRLWRF